MKLALSSFQAMCFSSRNNAKSFSWYLRFPVSFRTNIPSFFWNKQTYIQLIYFITFEAIQKKSILQNKLNVRNRIFSNFNPSNDSQSVSPWFKCILQATKWLKQVIRDDQIVYYITIIFEPSWWWSTRKSFAYNYVTGQIFAFSETLSKRFALQLMTSSAPLLLNCNIQTGQL